MPAPPEPRNPFYLLLLSTGMVFIVTVLAYAIIPVIEQKAMDAGCVSFDLMGGDPVLAVQEVREHGQARWDGAQHLPIQRQPDLSGRHVRSIACQSQRAGQRVRLRVHEVPRQSTETRHWLDRERVWQLGRG